uniref:Uncharacterized protein n=1 Tax=Pseudo-nitzschia australis TaxID=44445 RepID=A0A7S4EP78_9STRA|mmetsp:Transcript_275/g.694  ORF Transcript_275/g.694 Transcript_275/m.694 type:complete len:266 (+) Transcript_275:103-900(+)
MGKFAISCLALSALTTQVSSFSSPSTAIGLGVGTRSGQGVPLFLSSDNDQEHHYAPSRANFLNTSLSLIATTATLSLIPVDPAFARGRATLEQAYDRYSGRIIGGGNFYKNEMKTMIAKDDWAGIRAALQEPPKKTKADNAKIDGGIQERAAQAGQFSDARVLVALDLLAAQFSDNSISTKTKAMKKDVEEIRAVINEMQSICKQALGEESAKGGFFGVGKKQTSKKELSNRMKELYINGGTAWNRYAFAANTGIPKTVQQLPIL